VFSLRRGSSARARARETLDSDARIKENLQRSLGALGDDREVREAFADLKRQRDVGTLTDIEYVRKVAAKLGRVSTPASTRRR
jgi:hypothetical protein